MKLKNKKVLVYGLGDSGRAVLKLLQEKGACASFYDDDIKHFGSIGFEREPQNKAYDFVVVSPGVKCIENQLLQSFEKRKIPILSELDFGYSFCKGKILAITGTNGKTTVSMLTNRILKMAGYETFLCGNIGLPLTSICEKTTKDSLIVCEVSNFQLETSKIFKPDIACILNVKPDHLDRHGSFEEYKNTKAKLAKNVKAGGSLILNLDDDEAKKLVFCKKYQFFSKNKLKKGVFLFENQIFINKKPILKITDISIKGEKNLENVLASVSICSHFKVLDFVYEKAISSFTPASHRMEVVGKIKGITFVDDSKATNVASALACLETYKNENVVLLLGGILKESEIDEIFKNAQIKAVVCFGADGRIFFDRATANGVKSFVFQKFEDAVNFSKRIATEGDFVLLSPACSSFDEFSSYAERGECFKNLILENENGA